MPGSAFVLYYMIQLSSILLQFQLRFFVDNNHESRRLSTVNTHQNKNKGGRPESYLEIYTTVTSSFNNSEQQCTNNQFCLRKIYDNKTK